MQILKFISLKPALNLIEITKVVHNKYSIRNKEKLLDGYYETYYSWNLYKYLGEREYDGIDWQYASPSDITGVLSVENLIENLNNRNCFDFDYQFLQGDYLTISFDYVNPKIMRKPRPFLVKSFISVIYKNGQWLKDRYYDVNLEIIKNGIISF